MRIVAIALAACGLLLAAITVFAPATLADQRVAAASGGRLRIAEATGTLWNGSGVLTDAANSWRVPLAWNVSASALASGTLQVSLAPIGGAATPHGTIEFAHDAAKLRDLTLDVPASALSGALPPGGTIALGGAVALESPSFDWNGERGSGALNARWRNARLVAGGAAADLGTVDVTLAPQDNRLAGSIGNRGGDLHIEGTIAIASGTISVNASVTPAATASPQIKRALASFGTPSSDGAVRVAWRGALR